MSTHDLSMSRNSHMLYNDTGIKSNALNRDVWHHGYYAQQSIKNSSDQKIC